jgi:spore coat protein U-like protein
MKRILIPAMVAGTFFAAGGAQAGTASTTMGVSMTVASSCTVSATPLAFGTQTIIDMSADLDETTAGVLTVTCTNGEDYSVALGVGGGSGATFATRKMTGGPGGTATIDYTLYTDSNHTTVWGDGTASTSTVGGTGDGNPQTIDVYGQVPQQDNLAVGAYSDTVTVTVTY